MMWYEIENVNQILSPALAVYPDRILSNIQSMITIAGSPSRLRPHVKTYKMPQIVKMQMEAGITKFKCATITEAQMLIDSGCKDILLAMPTVGPAIEMIVRLKRRNKAIKLAALIDNHSQIKYWLKALNKDEKMDLFIDINMGMNRTGIRAKNAYKLYEALQAEPSFRISGIHAYDGHNRIKDFDKRKEQVNQEFDEVQSFLNSIGNTDLEIVCGGSVTFPCHALDMNKTLSPGTTLLWDAGYGSNFQDIPMVSAAVLIARVISKPGEDRICLDLGHKSVASEMQDKRVVFPQLSNYERVGHSEEHLVLKLKDRSAIQVGDVFYGIPWHICPTVALHEEVCIIESNKFSDQWPVVARKRQYTMTIQ